MRRCWLLLILTLCCAPAHAAGGSCPSGANYLSATNPTGSLVTLAILGITSCYYISASGSDSNTGTSETGSGPWLHAPGMPNCTSTCNGVTPAAGEGFIFRGGDTWHMGASTSPASGGIWNWAESGSSGSPIYIGVDPGWHSGSSWARPILNGDNSTSTVPVSSCSYSTGSQNIFVYLNGVTQVIFDNFEGTGLCWSNASLTNTFIKYTGANAGAANSAWIENNYMHGWTFTTGGTQAGGSGVQTYNQSYGETLRFNVIDGSDSDYLGLQPWSQGGDGYDFEYNVTRYAGGTSVFDDCHIQHDNLFEYMSNVTDGSSHTDIDFCYGEYSGGSTNPNIFYNNIFRYIGTLQSATVSYNLTLDTPSGQTDYVFNNVFHDFYCGAGGGCNYNAMCDGGGCGAATMWNNTAEGGLPGYTFVWGNGAKSVTVTSINNHWITAVSGTSGSFTGPSDVTETAFVYQTYSVATGQGYNSANDFSPTSPTNSTVTASGTNETSGDCASSVLHNTAAQAACVEGITGVSYNSTTHTVQYPAFAAAARPSTGSWNVGAYQFSAIPAATGVGIGIMP